MRGASVKLAFADGNIMWCVAARVDFLDFLAMRKVCTAWNRSLGNRQRVLAYLFTPAGARLFRGTSGIQEHPLRWLIQLRKIVSFTAPSRMLCEWMQSQPDAVIEFIIRPWVPKFLDRFGGPVALNMPTEAGVVARGNGSTPISMTIAGIYEKKTGKEHTCYMRVYPVNHTACMQVHFNNHVETVSSTSLVRLATTRILLRHPAPPSPSLLVRAAIALAKQTGPGIIAALIYLCVQLSLVPFLVFCSFLHVFQS